MLFPREKEPVEVPTRYKCCFSAAQRMAIPLTINFSSNDTVSAVFKGAPREFPGPLGKVGPENDTAPSLSLPCSSSSISEMSANEALSKGEAWDASFL